jgi:hypothetical protein
VITFTGELADQAVEPINAVPSAFFLNCEGATGSSCKKEATVTERSRGRSDGQIVVTATNLGDADANGETTPISVLDELPPGLKATAIDGTSGAFGSDVDKPGVCILGSLTCTFSHDLPPFEEIDIEISVVAQGASTGETNEVNVTAVAHQTLRSSVRSGWVASHHRSVSKTMSFYPKKMVVHQRHRLGRTCFS